MAQGGATYGHGPSRILFLELQPRWSMAVGGRYVRHALLEHRLGQFAGLRLELRILRRMRSVAAARDDQGHCARRIGHAEMERGKPAHGIADDMRAREAEHIEHAEDVVPRALLGIALCIRRHLRRRVTACVIGNAAVAAREMAQLRLPGAPVAGEFVHEYDRRSGTALLVMQSYAIVCGQGWHAGCSLQWHASVRIVVMPRARRFDNDRSEEHTSELQSPDH